MSEPAVVPAKDPKTIRRAKALLELQIAWGAVKEHILREADDEPQEGQEDRTVLRVR